MKKIFGIFIHFFFRRIKTEQSSLRNGKSDNTKYIIIIHFDIITAKQLSVVRVDGFQRRDDRRIVRFKAAKTLGNNFGRQRQLTIFLFLAHHLHDTF